MRVVAVCYGFERSNLRKQPWRYVHELFRRLPEEGVDPVMLTDRPGSTIDGIRIRTVSRVNTVSGCSAELVSALREEDPDVVVVLLGMTSFLRPRRLAAAVDCPAIGILTSPIYDARDVLNVGPREFYTHPRYVSRPLLGTIVPSRLIGYHSRAFDCLVTQTRKNGDRLAETGIDTTVETIRPGIGEFDMEVPDERDVEDVRADLNPAGDPLVMYFTSPLTLRGTDVLVRAVSRIRREYECTLLLLSRQDDGGLTKEETYLTRLAAAEGIGDAFRVIPRDLSPTGVKAHLAAADVVSLPFKLVISSVPLSILESMAIGNPVVSTRIAGIPELIDDDRQLVEPNDVSGLAAALATLVGDPSLRDDIGDRNRERMAEYQRWSDARRQFLDLLDAVR